MMDEQNISHTWYVQQMIMLTILQILLKNSIMT